MYRDGLGTRRELEYDVWKRLNAGIEQSGGDVPEHVQHQIYTLVRMPMGSLALLVGGGGGSVALLCGWLCVRAEGLSVSSLLFSSLLVVFSSLLFTVLFTFYIELCLSLSLIFSSLPYLLFSSLLFVSLLYSALLYSTLSFSRVCIIPRCYDLSQVRTLAFSL